MNMIVACDSKWGIGNKGELLVRIPQDQKLFQMETMGKVVVMGRKTLESLPQKRPLAGRTNLILSRNPEYRVRGAEVFHSAEELRKELAKYPSGDIYFIGGEEVYREFLKDCDTVHVTKIDYTYQADTYFPNLDQMEEWYVAEESDEQTYFDLIYYFVKYSRKA